MCGIAGYYSLNNQTLPKGEKCLSVMGNLLAHRGPDDSGSWLSQNQSVGLVHKRLSIIDLSQSATQPMHGENGISIVFNGEIYNYLELRKDLADSWEFHTLSDTETILAAYNKYGEDCLNYLRGMFAFALWDENRGKFFCARDRFGIKPFYYTLVNDVFYCASEIKALLPFVEEIDTDLDSLNDYLTFQFILGDKTLFKGIKKLEPGHLLTIEKSQLSTKKYWEVYYDIDFSHKEDYFIEKIQDLMDESIRLHMRSDVPVGSYVSGGRDSSIVAALASQIESTDFKGFTGKFSYGKGYDESSYAKDLSQKYSFELHELDIQSEDFVSSIEKSYIIWTNR